ncbi:hypothetical protein Emed_002614 [Eimeria media]
MTKWMSLRGPGLCLELGFLLLLLFESFGFSAGASMSETAGTQVDMWQSQVETHEEKTFTFSSSPLQTHDSLESVWGNAETETETDGGFLQNDRIAQPIQPSIPSPPRASFLRKASPLILFASLAFLLSASLVAVRGKRQTALSPQLSAGEKTKDKESHPNKDIISDLHAVRDSLPAAEELAEAVGTTEAQELFDVAYAAVRAGEEEIGKEDVKQLQKCLFGALNALRRLHQAACRAAEIADTYDYEDGKEIMRALLICDDESLSKAQRDGLVPFKTSIQISYLHYRQLSKQVQALREKIEAEVPYKIEHIKTSFLSAAADLEYLRKAKEERRRVFKRMVERRQGLQATYRLLLTQQAFNDLQQLREEFELAEMYVALVQEAAANEPEEGERRRHLETLKENIAKNEMLLASLIGESTSVLTGENFEKMKAQVKKVEASLELSKCELEKTWQSVDLQTNLPVSLDASLKAKAKTRLLQALERARRKHEMEATLESVHTAITEALDYRSNARSDEAKGRDGLGRAFLEEADSIASRTESVDADVDACKHSVQQLESLKDAESILRVAAATSAASLAELVKARLLIMRIHLSNSLKDEISSIRADAAAVFHGRNQHLKELKNKVHSAYQAAREAGTLREKAQAVAEMRKIADEARRAGRK